MSRQPTTLPTPTAPTPAGEGTGSTTAPATAVVHGPLPGGAYHARRAVVGPYRIVGLLGEGGMGTVYLAEQDAPVRREVALKLLRPGVARPEVLARFEAERQVLALMEHPNITRVYDAGATEAGLPYFVMERVSGTPITEYADARALTVRQRVALFRQVCGAVQHAHQKGIIHRDLKPSNVLVAEVDGQPHCKVIDFGIAKAVTPGPDAPPPTVTGTAVGTPAYMSPEQFTGSTADVDTRADVYALGVMLYELLAGVRPFDDAAGWALVARQTTGDVPTPSTRYGALPDVDRAVRARARATDPTALRQSLAGDLDAVLDKALEHDRERRYPTANDLAQDLTRYLRHEPVTAAHASGAYRLRKFVRRHRRSVAAAVALGVLLVAFGAVSAVQARRLARAERIAVARQAQAERLVGFMLGDLRDRLTPLGRLDLLDAVGDRALGYFAAVPESELSAEELYRRVEALQMIGQVRVDQGRLPEASALFAQAVAAGERLAARGPLRPEWRLAVAHAHFWAGSAEYRRGDVAAAAAHFEPFVRVSEALVAGNPDSASYRRSWPTRSATSARRARRAATWPGRSPTTAGRCACAASSSAAPRATRRRAATSRSPTTPSASPSARRVASRRRRPTRGRGRPARRRGRGPPPPTPDARRGLANAHYFLAVARLAAGDPARALAAPARPAASWPRSSRATRPTPRGAPTLAAADNLAPQLLALRGDAAAALGAADAPRSPGSRRSPAAARRARARVLIIARTARARASTASGAPATRPTPRAPPSPTASRRRARPADLDHRLTSSRDARLALGEALRRRGRGPRRAYAHAGRAGRRPIRRRTATGLTELLALRASALLDLSGRATTRAPRSPSWRAPPATGTGLRRPARAPPPAEPSGRRAAARRPDEALPPPSLHAMPDQTVRVTPFSRPALAVHRTPCDRGPRSKIVLHRAPGTRLRFVSAEVAQAGREIRRAHQPERQPGHHRRPVRDARRVPVLGHGRAGRRAVHERPARPAGIRRRRPAARHPERAVVSGAPAPAARGGRRGVVRSRLPAPPPPPGRPP
jgi:tetratricopeptide (TPR) repeat protein